MKIGKYNRSNWKFSSLTPELAYIVGVYLGDGFISTRCSITPGTAMRFGLRSIDKDFVEFTRDCILKTFGDDVPIRISIEKYTYKNRTKDVKMYVLDYSKNSLCNWLLSLTSDKQIVPEVIPRRKCAETRFFLEGLLDSEGWIAVEKRRLVNNRHIFAIGIAACDSWIFESKSLFQKFGIVIKGTQETLLKSGKNIFTLRLNVKSFAASSLKFHIKRKQDRLEFYKKEMQIDPLRDCAPGECTFSPLNDTVRTV